MKHTDNLTVPERKALRLVVLCLALLGGVGLFLGYANPFYQIPPLVLLFPACLATFSRIMPTGKSCFYAGWLCATIGSSACLYWVSVPMHDFGMVPWVLTVPAVLALGAYLGLYGALFSLLYRLFRERLPFFVALILVCPLWAALDIAKEYLFTGFPWITLATAFVAWPEWAQAASLIGGKLLSGAFALVAVAVAEARPVRLSPSVTSKKRQNFCILLGIAALIAIYACSFAPPIPEGRAVTVGLVQGNIDQNQKWSPEYQAGTLSRYLTLSEWMVDPTMGRLDKAVDVVLWPETSMPFYLETNELLAEKLTDFSQKFSVPVVFGAPGKNNTIGKSGYYNRMWMLTHRPEERQFYDKQHLVPFGEYLPLNIPLPFIEYLMQGVNFIPGTSNAPLKTGDLALGGLICYEAVFSDLARQRVADGANLLVNISNDAWFGFTSAPVQHLQLTAMRAIEQGRYIARATNTGISAVITPRGTIAAHGALFKAEAVAGTARLVTGLTLYHRIGPFIQWICIALAFAATAWSFFRPLRNDN